MALIKCPECGKEVSDTAKNCIHCGFVLKEDNNTAQPQTVIIAPEKGKSAKKSLNIGVTILLIATIISFIVYFLFFKMNIILGYDSAFNQMDNQTWYITVLGKIFYASFASIVMSILIFAVPKLRKKWFLIIYLLINIVSFPLVTCLGASVLLFFVAYVAGFVFIIKSMFIKD